ncbi:MAG: YHS domain-containing (seleno)protein, partial [Rhizobiaceae bacterium]
MTTTRRKALTFAGSTVALAAIGISARTVLSALAAGSPIYAEGGIAIDGTDPVSYFKQGRPLAGSADITFVWKGATWRFSSEENRKAFVASPEAYTPQYGGYCAYAVSEGYTASTVPEAWKIVDGKLYLNYSRGVQR